MDVIAHVLAACRRASGSDLTPDRRDRIARHVFDALALGVVGRQTRESVATRQALCLPATAETRLSAWGSGGDIRTAAATAAAVRLSEADDIHLPSCTTPGSIVVPAALFALDRHGPAPAERLRRGILAGYEVIGAIGTLIGGPRQVADGVWPSYLLATVGAATTIGTVLDFDEDLLSQSIASAFAVTKVPYSIRAGSGLGSRWLAFGLAVASGVAAAEGAAAGLRGDMSIPDRLFASGLLRRSDDASDEGARAEGVDLVLDRTSMKPFSAGRQSLSAVQAFMSLAADGDRHAEAIEKIVVSVPSEVVDFIDRKPPFADRRAMLGVQYQFGLSLFYPDDLYDIERDAPRRDPRIDAIASMVRLRPSSELAAAYPRHWGAEVAIHTRHEVRRRTVVVAKGDPEDPFDWSDLVDKTERLVTRSRLRSADVVAPALAWARMLASAPDGQALAAPS